MIHHTGYKKIRVLLDLCVVRHVYVSHTSNAHGTNGNNRIERNREKKEHRNQKKGSDSQNGSVLSLSVWRASVCVCVRL